MKKTDTFPNRLRLLIDKKGIRPAKLSADTGISKSLLSKYLNGSVSPKQDNLYILAHYFNVDYAYLLGYEEEPQEINNSNKVDIDYVNKELEHIIDELVNKIKEIKNIDKYILTIACLQGVLEGGFEKELVNKIKTQLLDIISERNNKEN